MSTLRRPLWLAAILSIALLAAACGSDDSATTTGGGGSTTGGGDRTVPKLAVFLPGSTPYTSAELDEAKRRTAELGGTITNFDAEFDAQKQTAQIQDAIATGKYNGFVVFPVDSASVVPLAADAADADIKVATIVNPIGPKSDTAEIQTPAVISSATNPGTLDGEAMAGEVKSACEGKSPCNVIFVAGDFGFAYDVGFQKGLKKGLEGASDVKIVATVQGEYSAEPAYNAMRDALGANRDVNVVTTTSDAMGVGVVRALDEAGLEVSPDGVRMIGAGGSEVGYEAVKDGSWFSALLYLPKSEMKFSIDNIDKALNGEEIEKPAVYTIEDLSPIGPFLRADNADEFTPEWTGQ